MIHHDILVQLGQLLKRSSSRCIVGYLENMLLCCQLKKGQNRVAIKTVSLKLFLKNMEEM